MIVMILLFFLILIIGVPVSFAVGLASYAGVLLFTDIPAAEVFSYILLALDNPLLLAVPFIILAANLMNAGGTTDRLIDVCSGLLGHKRGGLAYVNVLVSMIFAGITGSSQEDTASVGGNLIPAMEAQGYDKGTAIGVTAASSTIGCVIPPSVTMVVFCAIAGVDTAAMFVCGILPGLLMGVAMMLVIFFCKDKKKFPAGTKADFEAVKHQLMDSLPGLLTPVILIGGIISGWYTPTEASVFACLYALAIGMFFYDSIRLRDLPGLFIRTMKSTSLFLFALATANAMRLLVSYYHVDAAVIQFFGTSPGGKIGFLLTVEAVFLVIGMFIDAVPAVIIFVPALLPAAAALGISPYVLGLVAVITLALGLVTPPYGPCLLIASGISGVSMKQAFKGVLPYLLSAVAVLFLLALFSDVFVTVPASVFPELF